MTGEQQERLEREASKVRREEARNKEAARLQAIKQKLQNRRMEAERQRKEEKQMKEEEEGKEEEERPPKFADEMPVPSLG